MSILDKNASYPIIQFHCVHTRDDIEAVFVFVLLGEGGGGGGGGMEERKKMKERKERKGKKGVGIGGEVQRSRHRDSHLYCYK